MSKNLFDLRGTVAVVTGGTGHLGQSICRGLAEAGAAVAVCSTSARGEELANELRKYDVEAAGIELDLKDLSTIPGVISTILQRFGRIDCLVNNAHFGCSAPMSQMSPDEWRQGLDGTVTSAMFMLQACTPCLELTRGNVINISSMYGMVSPDPGMYDGTSFANPINYGAGKGALLQLTRYAAVHLAGQGIRVNAISPGPFPSREVQKNETFVQRLAEKVPLKRIGQPDELRGAVIFLASPAASYVTGHNLVIDGGWSVW